MSKALASVGFLHPGTYAACFAESMLDLFFYDASMHQRLMHPYGKMGKQCGANGIVEGRNKLVAAFLGSDADWLFMIDSDMGFGADTIERLIETGHAQDRPVVGGLAFAHKTDGKASFYGVRYRCQPTLYDWFEDDERAGFVPRFDYARDTVVDVAATGAACVLIHRNALQRVADKYGEVWFDQITHPTGTTFSEDLSFCIRVAGCDMPLVVDTRVKTGHDKGGVFYDEDYYIAQQAARMERVT